MSFAFDRARHDRAAHLRPDDAWRDGDVRVMVLGGEHVGTRPTDAAPTVRWLPADQAPAGQWIYLGELAGRHHAAIVVDGRVPDELEPVGVRVLAPLLGADDLSLVVHAVAMARWLESTPFCPRCGGVTEVRSAGHLRYCEACGRSHFPRTDPAVIMLVTDDDDRALLGHQSAWPDGRFSTLAGFVEPGENLEDAVRREVAEEVGVTVGEVRYAASQPWPFPASLMLGFFGRAETTRITVDRHEIAEARWFTRDELRRLGESGELVLPPRHISISRWLIETWYGGPVPGEWA